MAETFAKKEKEKKKAKKKLERAEKREERKVNNNKGKSFEDMIAYVDEFGNITNIPPDKQKRSENAVAAPQVRNSGDLDEDVESTGVVALFFEDKGYGFITEDKTRLNIFVHSNKLTESIKEKDRVTFRKESSPKGYAAVNVRKIK